MKYKYLVWNGREMVSPDYIDRQGYAHWKEDSIQCQSQKIVQFTGRKDKKGQEIYEGDIISKKGAFVVWSNDLACWCFTFKGDHDPTPLFYGDTFMKARIIGNIYANRELLKP